MSLALNTDATRARELPIGLARLPGAHLPLPAIALSRREAEEQRLIAEHLATKGVSRSVDFGEHQEAVETLKSVGHFVARARYAGVGPRLWVIADNGNVTTTELYRRANKIRADRGERPLKLPRKGDA